MSTTTATPPSFSAWPAIQHAADDGGIDPANLLALTASVLGGIAGPDSGFLGGLAIDRSISPNLMIPQPNLLLEHQLELMISHARTIQHRHRLRGSELRQEILDESRFGDAGKSTSRVKPGVPDTSDLGTIARETHRRAVGLNPHAPVTVPLLRFEAKDDLNYSPSALREAALRQPTTLLENPDLVRLVDSLPSLHLGRGLVSGRIDLLLARISGKRPTNCDLQTILDGFDLKLPPVSKRLTPLIGHAYARASAVVTAKPDSLSQLHRQRRSLLDRFVIMGREKSAAATGTTDTTQERPFIARVLDAIGQVLAKRRSHGGEIHAIKDPAKAAQYEHQRRDFLRRLDGQSEPVAGLASLPAAIGWTIRALHPDIDPQTIDRLIVATAVPCAEVILERHLAALAELKETARKAPRHDLEERIVERISRRGPMRDRDLRRTFSQQRAEVHDPAIDHLLTREVLIRDDRGRLDRGPRFGNFERDDLMPA